MRNRSELYKAFTKVWQELVNEKIVRDDPTLMIEAWIQFGIEESLGFPSAFDGNVVPLVRQ